MNIFISLTPRIAIARIAFVPREETRKVKTQKAARRLILSVDRPQRIGPEVIAM